MHSNDSRLNRSNQLILLLFLLCHERWKCSSIKWTFDPIKKELPTPLFLLIACYIHEISRIVQLFCEVFVYLIVLFATIWDICSIFDADARWPKLFSILGVDSSPFLFLEPNSCYQKCTFVLKTSIEVMSQRIYNFCWFQLIDKYLCVFCQFSEKLNLSSVWNGHISIHIT